MSAASTVVPICSIAKVARGGSPRPIKRFITNDPDGVNWIKIGDTEKGGRFITFTREKIRREGIKRSRWVEEGDFLLSNSMSFGRPYILKISGCIHDGWLVLTPDYSRVDQGYLYYALSSPSVVRQFDGLAAGSTVRNLNIGLVSSVTIPLPVLEEQKRIVAVLDQAFAALDRARANAEASLADAQKLFESSVDALLKRNRNGWCEGRFESLVGEVFTGPFGSLLHKSDYIENGIPIVNPSNIVAGVIEPDWTKCVSKEAVSRLTSYKLQEGDLVIGRRGEMGRCAPVPPHMDGWLCGTGSFIIRPKPGISSDFVGYLMRTPTMVARLSAVATGATMANLSNRAVAGIELELPAYEEQLNLLQTIKSLEAQIRCLQRGFGVKCADIAALRQSLLQKAFAGELV